MKIMIKDILNKEGKSIYWLSENLGVRYPTVFNLCNNKTKSISFDLLEQICLCLDCSPNDIFCIEESDTI